MLELLIAVVMGLITSLVVSILFYRKSILDPMVLKMSYCDSTVKESNIDVKTPPPDRNREGLDYTEHHFRCYLGVITNAGMDATVRQITRIIEELGELKLLHHRPGGLNEEDCGVNKALWERELRSLYSWPATIPGLIPWCNACFR